MQALGKTLYFIIVVSVIEEQSVVTKSSNIWNPL